MANIAPVTGAITFDVPECAACGASHEQLTAQPLKAARPPHTHWYECPVHGDPVLMTLVMQGANPIELNRRIMQDVADAQAHGGPVMFATFGLDKRLGVTLVRHCANFPTNRMEEAVRLLHKNLKPEMPLPEPDAPLPKADLQSVLARSVNAVRNGAGKQEEVEEDDAPDSEEQ